MTATSFPDASFGLVLDKGGLDALMGDGDAGSLAAGEKLLLEVDRLLRPGDGAYVCVTLAQEHVLGANRFCPPQQMKVRVRLKSSERQGNRFVSFKVAC